jgi:lipopolysaccharide export LptBFGC system permease protein LptF
MDKKSVSKIKAALLILSIALSMIYVVSILFGVAEQGETINFSLSFPPFALFAIAGIILVGIAVYAQRRKKQ